MQEKMFEILRPSCEIGRKPVYQKGLEYFVGLKAIMKWVEEFKKSWNHERWSTTEGVEEPNRPPQKIPAQIVKHQVKIDNIPEVEKEKKWKN